MTQNTKLTCRATTLGVAFVLLTLLAPATLAHELLAPEVVRVERDGSFDFESLFRVGPGPAQLSFYEVTGSQNLDMRDLIADGRCVDTAPAGTEITIELSGSLIDPTKPGTAVVHLEICGGGPWTQFEAEIAIVPFREHSIYWLESEAIRRSRLDGSHVEEIVGAEDAEATGFIDIDPVGGKVYWSGSADFATFVRRADLFGTVIEGFPGSGGKSAPGGIAIDLVHRELYSVDPSDCIPLCGSIHRIRLDAGSNENLIFLNQPLAVAVDPFLDTMCWTDDWDDWIQCSDLDGEGVQTVMENTAADGVALDPVLGKVYWTDENNQRIRRADTDGSHVEDLVTSGLDHPRDLAVDPVGRKIYWTDAGTAKIQRANLDGSHVEDVLTELSSPRGIALNVGQGFTELELESDVIRWSVVPGANAFDVVVGHLGTLHSTGGDFSGSVEGCLADTTPDIELTVGDPPTGWWFLVRPVTVTGNGTYDSGGVAQVESRDAEIAASGDDCN